MRDKDIDVRWNQIAFLCQGATSGQKERARIVSGLPWATPKHQTIDRHAFVLKIEDVRSKQSDGLFTLIGKAPVMVARDEDLDGVRLRAKPIGEQLELGKITFPSHVPCVDQHITCRKNTKIGVISMRVGNRNNLHWYSLLIPSIVLILFIIISDDLDLRSFWLRPRDR